MGDAIILAELGVIALCVVFVAWRLSPAQRRRRRQTTDELRRYVLQQLAAFNDDADLDSTDQRVVVRERR